MTDDKLSLNSNLAELRGVGPVLNNHLITMGLSTISDLINNYPRKYNDYSFAKNYLISIVLDKPKWYNMYMEHKFNNNVVYSCKYHVVWCPKYRRSVLINGVDVRLKELIKETCDSLNAEIIEMEIMPDHVHLLIEVDPQFGINRAIRSIKGFSSYTLRKEFPLLKTRLPTLWTNSYFVSTVGGAPLEIIKQYIENQQTSERRKKT